MPSLLALGRNLKPASESELKRASRNVNSLSRTHTAVSLPPLRPLITKLIKTFSLSCNLFFASLLMAAGSLYGVAASKVRVQEKEVARRRNFFKRRGGGGSILIKGRDKKHGIPKLFSKRNQKKSRFQFNKCCISLHNNTNVLKCGEFCFLQWAFSERGEEEEEK